MLDGGHAVQSTRTNNAGKIWIILAAAAILAVSLGLIALTYQISQQPETIPLEWQWNLRWEHNFAAWWSGSLLALASVLAFDNAHTAPGPHLRRAWSVLALIILFLALDEIGSLHERMGTLSNAMGAGTWAIAIPLGIIIAILSIKAGWTMLMHGGRERVQIFVLGFGFAVLLSVAVQEYLEHNLDWTGLAALRAAVEEGSELVGISIVIAAVGWPLLKAPAQAFASVIPNARKMLIGAGIFALPFLAISADLNESRGYPSDWIASALFLGAGFIWARQFWTSESRFIPLVLAGLCVLASLCSVAMGHDESFGIAGFEIARRGLVYTMLGTALLVIAGWRAGMALLVPTVLLILLSSASPLWVFALGTLCGMAAFWSAVQEAHTAPV